MPGCLNVARSRLLQRSQDGYALLVSVVVIATVLVMLATVTARRVQDGFFASIDLHQATQAQALALGCAHVALLNRATDSLYAGNEIMTIQEESCTIFPITGSFIDVEASVQERYYRIHIELTADEPPAIASWERVVSF